jgi:hypothetical protein
MASANRKIRDGKRPGTSRESSCGRQGPEVKATVKYVSEKGRCVEARRVSYGMVESNLLCFSWLSSFFNRVQKGITGFD